MSLKRFGSILFLSITLGIATVAALTWLLMYSHENVTDVDLNSPPVVVKRASRKKLRFAVAPVLSPERTISDYHDFADYLASQLSRPVQLVQRKTYHEVNELLRHGSVQVAIICTGAYLHTKMEQIPLEPIAVPVYSEGPVYHSLLVVRTESNIKTIEDLKNRSFAFSDPLSLSGHYYPLYLLLKKGMDPAVYFSRTTFAYSHDGSLLAVLDGIAEGAAVDGLVYDLEARRNPSITKKLRVIHRSPPLGINPVVIPNSIDSTLRESLREVFLSMHDVPEGKKVLDILDIRRFQAPSTDLYRDV